MPNPSSSTTVSVNFKPVQDKFIHALNGPKVLDFGCGSGRDTKYFLESGLQVTAVDGSEEMCRYASEFTGIQVQNMLFQDLDAQNQYDGIWACSSILHLPKSELHMVLSKMAMRCVMMELSTHHSNMEILRASATEDILRILQ